MQLERINVDTIVCRECRTENSGSRGFCSSCGDSLWMNCPECQVQVGVSETFCGGCGFKLAEWLVNQTQQACESIAQSRANLEAKEFDLALAALGMLSKYKSLGKALKEEAKALSESIQEEKSTAQAEANKLAEQAKQHLEEGACVEALELWQKIVPTLLTAEMKVLLDKATAQMGHLTELSRRIDAAFKGKVTVESLLDADRMLAFQPNHAKAWRLGEKLRDQVIKLAQTHFERDDPERALQLLDKIPPRFLTDRFVDLQTRVKDYYWLILDVRFAPHVDRTLVESANRIKKQFPQQQQINQLIPELSKRFAESSKDPLLRLKNWSKQEVKPFFGFPVDYLHLDNCVEGFEKLAEFKTPYATTFATAIGLAIGGLEQAEFPLSLELPTKKKFSLGKVNIGLGGGKKKNMRNSIGIDLGHSCLRVVRLSWEKGDRPKIEEALQIEYNTAIGLHLDEHSRPTEIVNALRKLKEKLNFSKHAVVVSLSALDAFFRVCPLPDTDKKQLQQLITYEARHQIPFPLENVAWTHQLFSKDDQHTALLFAAKREAIERFALAFQMAEMEFTQIQAAPIALLNLWNLVRAQIAKTDPAAANASTALLDVGHQFSTLIVRKNNEISLRVFDVAGDKFSRKLVHAFNLTFEQAEHLKRAPYESPQMSRVFQHLQPSFELMEGEISKSLSVLGRDGNPTLPGIMYCTGGGSLLHGLIRSLRNGADSMIV